MSSMRTPATPDQDCRTFSLLVIDSDISSIDAITRAALDLDLDLFTAKDPEEGIELFRRIQPQLVMASITQPGMSGLELVSRLLHLDASAQVVLMSRYSSMESAVEVVTNGAAVLKTPICETSLRMEIGSRVKRHQEEKHAPHQRHRPLAMSAFDGIIGRSAAMAEVFSQI